MLLALAVGSFLLGVRKADEKLASDIPTLSSTLVRRVISSQALESPAKG